MTKYEDDRGIIYDFLNGHQVIVSFAGKTRANHTHRSSGHWTILTRGKMEYYERPAGSNETPSRKVLSAPAMFHTGPNVEHTMFFVDESDMACIRTDGSFNHDEYELDLVRFNYSLRDVYIQSTYGE